MPAFFNIRKMLDGMLDLINNLKNFDEEQAVIVIIEKNEEKIVDLQRDQMMEGRGVDGNFIRPYYSENPYFKTAEAAKKYAKWKAKITPNPQRPEDVPNLYINGYFHSSLFVKIMNDQFEIDTDADFGGDVFDVHKNAQGLNEEKRLLFAENITIPQFAEALKLATGLTF